MSIVHQMTPKNICDTCPHAQPSQLVGALSCIHEQVRGKLASNIREQKTPNDQLDKMLIHLTIVSFGGPDFRVEARTAYAVTQCLRTIWDLGSRGFQCSEHHMREIYEQAGR